MEVDIKEKLEKLGIKKGAWQEKFSGNEKSTPEFVSKQRRLLLKVRELLNEELLREEQMLADIRMRIHEEGV